MALIPQPQKRVIWASSGNIAEPSTEQQELGFVVEKPPYEVMNWILYEESLRVDYLFQEGISKWNPEIEYGEGSLCKFNNRVYESLNYNINKPPNTSPLNWSIAYARNQDLLDLSDEIERIKTEDDYVDILVYKNKPVFNNKAIGTSISTNKGLPKSSTDQMGYVFNDSETSGLVHVDDKVSIADKGDVVASFNPTPDIDVRNDDVVTFENLYKVLDKYQRYGVDDIYITLSNENPRDKWGYGTWVLESQGKAIVGKSELSSENPEWTKINGNTAGSYTHSLTEKENGKHKHTIKSYTGYSYAGDSGLNGGQAIYPSDTTSGESGEGEPHNNVQPSMVFNIWRRVS